MFAADAESRAGQGGERATSEMDLTQRLPEEMLADVLHRLPPRSLAAARCVCTSWHATIDARRLLDRDLVPLSLAGFFINFFECSGFFCRPSTDAAIRSGNLHFLPTDDDIAVQDICNGLVLLSSYVVNPATRRWDSLPPRPPRPTGFQNFRQQDYILFDPTLSPHYQVLRFLYVPYPWQLDAPTKQQQWPPSPFTMHVFSSETRRWEETTFFDENEETAFIRQQGDALGTIAEYAQLAVLPSNQHQAVYWHGELYVLSHFVIKLSLSNRTYQAIRLPVDDDYGVRQYPSALLGRSQKGVYFAALDHQCRLRVWVLDESSKWLLKHDSSLHDIQDCNPQARRNQLGRNYWTTADVNYKLDHASSPFYYQKEKEETPVRNKFEWYSDDEDVLEARIGGHTNDHITILGFHPYREVIFLSEFSSRGFAYHLDQSKLEDLGNMRPKGLDYCCYEEISQCFAYTPCWSGHLLDK